MLHRVWDAATAFSFAGFISFGEMKARRIFSFAFHIARFIDASLSRGIPSRQIRQRSLGRD
jgi:hypothetical protein